MWPAGFCQLQSRDLIASGFGNLAPQLRDSLGTASLHFLNASHVFATNAGTREAPYLRYNVFSIAIPSAGKHEMHDPKYMLDFSNTIYCN
jgi:hypothetical protein